MPDITTFPGLWLAPNQVSAPAGAMDTADNVYGAADSRLVPRPGFDAISVPRLYPSMGLTRDPATLEWGLALASPPQDGFPTGSLSVAGIGAVPSATTVAYGPTWEPSYMDPSVRDAVFTHQSKTYVSGRRGLHVLENIGGTWYSRPAGMPKALPPIVPGQLSAGGPGTTAGTTNINLNSNSAWAYRCTLRLYLPDGTVHEGPPSERAVYQNLTGGALIPGLTFFFPPALPLALASVYTLTVCVWRSQQAPVANGPPSDELYLVQEIALSPIVDNDNFGSLSTGFQQADIVSDGQLAIPLYTNQNAGSQPARYRPPRMSQAINFKGQAIGGRTEEQTRATLAIYGTQSSGGLVAGASLQIDGISYTATPSSTALVDELNQVFNFGTAVDVPKNLAQTAASLARAINFYYLVGWGRELPIDHKLVAYAINDGTDVGRVVLERPLAGGDPITVTNLPTADIRLEGTYTPVLPDDGPATLAWAETDDPESWPLENRQPLGNTTARLLSLKSSRNAFFACTDLGIFVGRGDGATIPELQLASATERLIAPNSVAVLDDTLYGLFDGGFLSCDENGNTSEKFAQPINAFLQEETRLLQNLAKATVAWADESRNLYICAVPAAINELAASKQYVYATRTGVWSTWSIPDVVSAAFIPTTIQVDTGQETEARSVVFCSSLPDEGDTQEGAVTQNILRAERIEGAASAMYRDADYELTCPGAGFTALTSILPGGPTPSQIATGSLPGVTCSRAASAYVTRPDGSLVLLGPNTVRVDGNGLLRERASLQRAALSTAIYDTGAFPDWSMNGTPLTFSGPTTEVTAPDGTLTASKNVFPAVAAGVSSWLLALASVAVFPGTFSVYLRMPAGQTGTIYLNGRVNQISMTECLVTDQWQRFQVNSSGYMVIGYGNDSGTAPGGDGGTFYCWGAQLEDYPTATSFIPGPASSTRDADVITLDNPLNPSSPSVWSASVRARPQGPWQDEPFYGVTGADLMGTTFNSGSWLFIVVDPTDVAFHVYDGGAGLKSVRVSNILSGQDPVTITGIDNTAALSTIPPGILSGAGTGVVGAQGATIYLGQRHTGAFGFGGWFTDITVGTGVPTDVPVSRLVFSPASLIAGVVPGDLFTQAWDGLNAGTVARVLTVDYDTGVVTFTAPGRFTPGLPIKGFSSIPCTLHFLPLTGGEALAEKDFIQVLLYLRQWDGDFCQAQLDSERKPIPLKTLTANAPGTVPFPPTGAGAVASQRGADVLLRFGTDINAALAARLGLTLRFQNAKTQFDLAAINLLVGDATPDASRR